MLPQEVGQLFRFCSVEKSSNRVVVDRDFACVLRLSFSPLGFYRRGYRILAPYVKVVLSFSLRRLAPGCFTRVQRPHAAAPCEFPVDFVASFSRGASPNGRTTPIYCPVCLRLCLANVSLTAPRTLVRTCGRLRLSSLLARARFLFQRRFILLSQQRYNFPRDDYTRMTSRKLPGGLCILSRNRPFLRSNGIALFFLSVRVFWSMRLFL